VARLEPRLAGRAVGRHALHDRALAILQAEFVDGLWIHRADRDTDAPACDFADAQLRQQFSHRVAGNGEADADVALLPGVRVDSGVDPDHLAAQVEQRSARVAG